MDNYTVQVITTDDTYLWAIEAETLKIFWAKFNFQTQPIADIVKRVDIWVNGEHFFYTF